MKYEVYVGNIGTTMRTDNQSKAIQEFEEWCEIAAGDSGSRACGEDVAMFKDGDIILSQTGWLTTEKKQEIV